MEMPELCSVCKASSASGREGGHTCPFIQPTLPSRYSVPSTVPSVLLVLHLGTEAALVGHPNAQGLKPHPCPQHPANGPAHVFFGPLSDGQALPLTPTGGGRAPLGQESEIADWLTEPPSLPPPSLTCRA